MVFKKKGGNRYIENTDYIALSNTGQNFDNVTGQ